MCHFLPGQCDSNNYFGRAFFLAFSCLGLAEKTEYNPAQNGFEPVPVPSQDGTNKPPITKFFLVFIGFYRVLYISLQNACIRTRRGLGSMRE
jgi:hypothetical protein